MRAGFEKRFKTGDIVYWHRQTANNHFVEYGMVDEQFSDAVVVDLLEPIETRRIDGVPLEQFESPSKWRKLPKGWRYDTDLIKLTYGKLPEFFDGFKIDNPDTVAEAYKRGMLVKASTNFHGSVEDEISRAGYRVVLKWDSHAVTRVSIRPDKVYFTYAEAKREVDAYYAEIERQKNLTDYEWSVEQIEHDINRVPGLTDDERAAYKKWLLAMDNVEDIETRVVNAGLQWKYWKSKKWNNIEYAEITELILQEGA